MEKYQQLKGTFLDISHINSFLNELKILKSGMFKYDLKNTKFYAAGIFKDLNHVACFSSGRNMPYSATVWMVIDECNFRVTNITPKDCSSFSIDKYNEILRDFYEFLKININKFEFSNKIELEITAAHYQLNEVLNPNTFTYLERWAKTCNRDTPLSHESDLEFWLKFVISYHQNDRESSFTTGDLEKYLLEDCSWSSAYDEQIHEVLCYFEYSIDLLNTLTDNGK